MNQLDWLPSEIGLLANLGKLTVRLARPVHSMSVWLSVVDPTVGVEQMPFSVLWNIYIC